MPASPTRPPLLATLALLLGACAPTGTDTVTPPTTATTPGPPAFHAQTQLFKQADPSVIRVGGTYYSVQSDGNQTIRVRAASSVDGLASATPTTVYAHPTSTNEVWAPELIHDGSTYYIYFTMGAGDSHRMYVMQSSSPTGGYSAPAKLNLPDDKWAIDGTLFTYNAQRYFVWSGWVGDRNGEQTLFLSRMSSPTTVASGETRHVISQPRESWEQADPNPPTRVNEGPEAIKDPSGQLHIVYSANGSWDSNYCLADLRLRAGGDPTYVWDWYKSNGCLFGSKSNLMMSGWDPTLSVNGPGHHSFVLLDGDINTSPPSGQKFPLMYHAVSKSLPYTWANRFWYSGSFMWWGNMTYTRGGASNTGWSLKFFE
ncbi:glycoside hydrolase family 43 protein [Deinococcus maricopensis]|uniref:Glycoside hydrolase family 43 n=1 Tax=Deinococcus maricopensis (strain DSM 21211 / LMG 22137 / NRRL B-23946 / LB-34) TaxID=709986 RepID=E8U4T6_DEIML|nr:glycoside hydrolase family 43 protein [Deinococcus maricopensis]ADV66075.1 glycoside hydrolase family 43 [Deinococcus maricopensis DSM 21211]